MFYSDHLANAEKEITSSNFCCLVEAAVLLYEEEQDRKFNTKKKTLSEQVDKSFFHVFPRKTRTSVKKFLVSKQQNLHEITADSDTRNPQNPPCSSSSMFLGDHKITAVSEKRNPRSPPFSFSSLFVGDYKIMAESESRNPRNPNSSSLLLSLGDGKMVAESEKKVKRNPRNPNSQWSQSPCVTEKKRRKRRAVQERMPSDRCKKAKVEAFSWIGRETPEWLTQLMRDINGADLSLIFERSLYKTDLNPKESRLSMPFNELIKKDFLTPVESSIIEEDINNDKKMGVGGILFDQEKVKWGVMLKRWEMKKISGNGSWNYALTCGWNDIVKANRLKLNDRISIWSFRWGGLLCFALVTPPSMPQASSSSLVLCL
ncbi:unnamed protein product [Arabis nemorensis]|uniref:TF-B3 domain-containing protein n=1 Tax=Arabis nemorensis TaxID=586526 RepID=A0A565BET1_9BRAS|nr:unnamed protein product [Arabis nemorensis]